MCQFGKSEWQTMAENQVQVQSSDGDMVSCDASKVTLQRDDVRGTDGVHANAFGTLQN